MARIFAFLALFATLAAGAPWLVPMAKESYKLVAARDDPSALADLGLSGFSAQDAARAIADALAEDDAALAASYLALCDARGLAVPPELRAKVEAASGTLVETLRSAKAFGLGFVTGEPRDLAGLAGAAASDLMVWGDIRDAGREGLKLARGEEADQLILGLSAVGIAVTAGTYATVGASLPMRIGISLVKVAKRTGRLSASLARSLTRAVRESVDFAALRRLLSGTSAADGAALKGVVRTDRLASLTRMLDDTARIEAKAGTRAALEGLKVADGGRDLSRIARLADAKGQQTLAILKTVGRGAITITAALFHLIWWGIALVAYLFMLVSSLNSFCVACARATWKRKGRRRMRSRRTAPRPAAARPTDRSTPWPRDGEASSEPFRAKQIPARVKDTRQIEGLTRFPDAMHAGNAPAADLEASPGISAPGLPPRMQPPAAPVDPVATQAGSAPPPAVRAFDEAVHVTRALADGDTTPCAAGPSAFDSAIRAARALAEGTARDTASTAARPSPSHPGLGEAGPGGRDVVERKLA